MSTTPLIEALFNGLSNSSILILTALGLAITFGVMGVINMAHGEMLMLGAYTGYVVTDPQGLPKMVSGLAGASGLNGVLGWLFGEEAYSLHIQTSLSLNLYYAIPIAFIVVGLVGYLLEVGLIRFLYGRPLDTLLATWGVGLMLQQIVRLVFGPDLKPLSWPTALRENWVLGGASIPCNRLFIIGIACVALIAVYLGFFRTPFGLKVRAVTQNRAMASATGISTRQVDSLTFAFGTGLAGVAGCIFGHQFNVTPDMGNDYIVDAFMVVILGGMGRLLGTVLGGVVIGMTMSLLTKLFDNSLVANLFRFPIWIEEVNQPMARVAVLLLVIGFIMVRPAGLLALKERVYD
jgi:urea transport system permease protein